MKHTVENTSEGLRIRAVVALEKQGALLEEFAKCTGGNSSCPSAQFDKLRSIDVKAQPAGVTVDLQAKPGEVIDAADIERCLEHTAKQVGVCTLDRHEIASFLDAEATEPT